MAEHDDKEETEEQANARIQDFQVYVNQLYHSMGDLFEGLPMMSSLTAMPLGITCPEHHVHDKVVLVFQTMDRETGAYGNHVMSLSLDLFKTLVQRVFNPIAMGLADDQAFIIKPKEG